MQVGNFPIWFQEAHGTALRALTQPEPMAVTRQFTRPVEATAIPEG
jgi:hypothetical protein